MAKHTKKNKHANELEKLSDIAILQERVKISSSWPFFERKLDFHVRMFSSSSHLFLLMLHYKNLYYYHPSRRPAEGPVHCFSSYKQ